MGLLAPPRQDRDAVPSLPLGRHKDAETSEEEGSMRPDTLPQRGDLFQHFKGGFYLVLEIALNVDDETSHVVYTPLYDPHQGKVVTRPLSNWLEPKGDQLRFRRADTRSYSCCGGVWISRATNRLQLLTGHSLASDCLITRKPADV